MFGCVKGWEASSYDLFGLSNAALDDWVAVGAPQEKRTNPGSNTPHSPGTLSHGAAYLYKRSGPYTWAYYPRMNPSAIPTDKDMTFGYSLSFLKLGGPEVRLAVGAYSDHCCDTTRVSTACT